MSATKSMQSLKYCFMHSDAAVEKHSISEHVFIFKCLFMTQGTSDPPQSCRINCTTVTSV